MTRTMCACGCSVQKQNLDELLGFTWDRAGSFVCGVETFATANMEEDDRQGRNSPTAPIVHSVGPSIFSRITTKLSLESTRSSKTTENPERFRTTKASSRQKSLTRNFIISILKLVPGQLARMLLERLHIISKN